MPQDSEVLQPSHSKTMTILMEVVLCFLAGISMATPHKGYAEVPRLPACYIIPDPIIQGVNVLNGNYVIDVMDISTEGVDPIALHRYWNSRDPSARWNYGLTKHLYISRNDNFKCIIYYPDGQGGMSRFSSNEPVIVPIPGGTSYVPWKATFLYDPDEGNPNSACYSGSSSGQHHPDNIRIEMKEGGEIVTAYHGDGTIHRFVQLGKKKQVALPLELELEMETLPSGNQRLMWYLKEKGAYYKRGNIKLETRSSKGKFLNHLIMEKIDKKDSTMVTNENITANYHQSKTTPIEESLGSHRFKRVINQGGVLHSYQYDKHDRLIRKELPDDRVILVNYNDAGTVAELQQPVPNDLTVGKYAQTYQFAYQSKPWGYETRMVTPDRGLVKFIAHKGKLLQSARYPKERPAGSSETAYTLQKFFWGNKKGSEDLLAIGFFSREYAKQGSYFKQTAIGCRSFVYDKNHNMTEEYLYGNLSGGCDRCPWIEDTGVVCANGAESTCLRRRYSEDGRNLLLEMREESGKVTTYTYKDGTNLLTGELVGDGTKNIHRTFHAYNDQGVRIETMIDDGVNQHPKDSTGVTTRRLTRLTVKQEAPFAGTPLREEEYFLNEAGNYQLLQQKVNEYNENGRIIYQLIDGGQGKQEVQTWSYDLTGNLIQTMSPAGTITYAYDANGNRIEENFVEIGLHRYNVYDRLNHLIERKEVTADKQERIWRYVYNMQGQCIEETNPFNQKTVHIFDDYGREVETCVPAGLNPQGQVLTCGLRYSYNYCDQKSESGYVSGEPEKMTYNMRGQLTRQTFADGSFEMKEYTLGGALKKTVSRLGLVTVYDTDFMGRAIVKRDYDKEGVLLSTVHYAYQGLLLKSVEHEQGSTIVYRYDGAGRLIQQERNQEVEISYTYGGMGRVQTKKEWIDATSAKVTVYSYNDAGKVTCERECDLEGNVLAEQRYAYDLQGNRTEECHKVGEEESITKTRYDAWGQVLETIDPEGNTTHYSYETDVNSAGQNVQKVTRCDAKGRQHITLYHTNGQVAEEKDVDSLGNILRRHQLFFNEKNQMVERRDFVYTNGYYIREIVTQWSYNNTGQIATLIEAVGTPDERQTHTLYTADGQPKRIQLPSNEVQEFAYNVKGEKIEHRDHRGTFCFVYTYDQMGNVTEVVDKLTNTKTKRVYNLRGTMEREELGNGLVVSYRHDLFGRTKEVLLPDGSSVAYAHDPVYLRSITRLDQEGNVRYTHRYTDIDLSGNTLQEELAGNGGLLQMAYTKRGMIQSIQHDVWGQETSQGGYDELGNLIGLTTRDPSGETHFHYAYDTLNQLQQEEGQGDEQGQVKHDYTYDSLYNRQVQDGVQGQFNSLNQLLDRGDCVYHYDKNGQTISIEKGGTRTDYSYDGLGRLTSLESGNQRITYHYDAFHRRLAKTKWTREFDDAIWSEVRIGSDKDSERFLYLDQNEVGSVDQEGRLLNFRVLGRGVGAEIGASIALEIAERTYVPLHDQSGSITALLDETGSLVEYARYSAFGEQSLFDAEQQALSESAIGNPWGYASKRMDSESGWNFFGRRYYNPKEGRWMTPDPLGFADGPNLYAYVHNSPMTHSDLYGLITANNPYTPAHRFYIQGLQYASLIGDLASTFWGKARPLMQIPGKIFETLSRHFLPVPGLRDVCMGIGRVISFRPYGGCDQCRQESAQSFVVGTVAPTSGAYTYTNGVCNSLADFTEGALRYSAANGNVQVHANYNPSYGLSLDVLRSLYMMAGGLTESSYNLAQSWKQLASTLKPQANGEPGIIYHAAHSQGGQETWAARRFFGKDDSILSRQVEVKTYGSAELIPQGIFRDAQNYVSKRDAVPFIASPHRYIQAKRGRVNNVHFLDSDTFFGIDHAMGGGTYERKMINNGKKLQATIWWE